MSIWHRILRGVQPGQYSERAIRKRRAYAKVCICPSHASNRGECPIHDDKGRVRDDDREQEPLARDEHLEAALAENSRLHSALRRISDPTEITGDGPLEGILADPHGTGERELRARMRIAREASNQDTSHHS